MAIMSKIRQQSEEMKLSEITSFAVWTLYFALLFPYTMICVFAAVRYRFFECSSFWIYLFLGITIYGTIFLLRFLRSFDSRPIGAMENCFIFVPACILGLFVVLPGLNFLGILLYVSFLTDSFHRAGLIVIPEFKRKNIVDEDLEIEPEPDENAFFRLIRSQNPDRLETWIKVHFATEEKTVNVHIPFCPTFDVIPKIESYQLDGNEVDLEVSQLTPLGARLDVKRPVTRKGEETVQICAFATTEN